MSFKPPQGREEIYYENQGWGITIWSLKIPNLNFQLILSTSKFHSLVGLGCVSFRGWSGRQQNLLKIRIRGLQYPYIIMVSLVSVVNFIICPKMSPRLRGNLVEEVVDKCLYLPRRRELSMTDRPEKQFLDRPPLERPVKTEGIKPSEPTVQIMSHNH